MHRGILKIDCRLKPYKTSELVFSCMRSKISYGSHREIAAFFKDTDPFFEEACSPSWKCNPMTKRALREKVKKITCDPIFYDGKSNRRDAQGFIVWDPHTIYVSYRGTLEPWDVLDNIDIRHKSLQNNIKVHRGFFEQFESIEEAITRDIKRISREYPIDNLVFTGHSLGGSVATISSPFYGQLFRRKFKITTQTLGSAPCGNAEFINWFVSNVDENVRLETEGDIVPYVPIHDKFYHVPNGMLLKCDGTLEDRYEIKPYDYFTLLCMIFKKEQWLKIYEDHSCENYIQRLFALDTHFSL